jgi:hypothetical protein
MTKESAMPATYNRSVDTRLMPDRIRRLPVSATGFPVPWFVTWFKDNEPCRDGDGVPDFRVVDPGKMRKAVANHLCWICGDVMGVHKCFVIGPMCAVNRVNSEPPSHRDCAIFAARACPFLSKPKMARNEKGLHGADGGLRDGLNNAAGIHLTRNPGAVCVWITKSYRPFKPAGGGVLFSLGRPIEALWFAEGRRATRKEVMASIDSGYPLLEKVAQEEGKDALAALAVQREVAMALLPD